MKVPVETTVVDGIAVASVHFEVVGDLVTVNGCSAKYGTADAAFNAAKALMSQTMQLLAVDNRLALGAAV